MNKRQKIGLLLILVLLLLPFIAMQFTNEVNWSLFDFILAGILLLCNGMLIDFVFRKVKNTKHRIIICMLILISILLLWIELAVGLFGTIAAGN